MNDVTAAPRRVSLGLVAAVLFGSSLGGTEQGLAQERGPVLEEVVVTAQKREQSVQDIGISISALTGERLSQLNLESSTDITRLVPGMHIAGQAAGQQQTFTIRGVTQNDFNDFAEPPNAVYIDEGYVASQQGQLFGMFDIERVEVLKGPQGTLFGRNATGGVVHYVTRKPTPIADGYTNITVGSYDQMRLEGAVGGPLSDRVSTRVSAIYNRHDAIYNNLFPLSAINEGSDAPSENLNNEDVWAARAQLLFEPGENLEILISAFGSQRRVSAGAYQQSPIIAVFDAQGRHIDTLDAADTETREAIGPGGIGVDISLADGDFDGTRPVPGGDLFGYRDPDGGGTDLSVDFGPDDSSHYRTEGATVRLVAERDGFTFTSLSHYMHIDRHYINDVDAGPAPQGLGQLKTDVDNFTQEFRLHGDTQRSHWVSGLYFLHIDAYSAAGLGFPRLSPFTTLVFGAPVEANTLTDSRTTAWSIFGQADFALTDKVTLVTGARAIREERDFAFDWVLQPNLDDAVIEDRAQPLSVLRSYEADSSKTLWAGKLQLEYRPKDNHLAYLGVNRGVKAGGFNAPLNDFSPAPAPDSELPYGEETVLAYELGLKSTILGGTTRLNAAAFYYDYSDYQAFVFQHVSNIVRNADMETSGLEFGLHSRPVDGLDLLLNASFIGPKVKNVEVAPGIFRNVEPSFSPRQQASAMIRYEWDVPALNGSLAVHLDAKYSSEFYHNIRNFSQHRLPSYTTGNASLSWQSRDDRWLASLFVKNATDRKYRLMGFDLATLCGCSEDYWGDPRWYGFSLRYRFAD